MNGGAVHDRVTVYLCCPHCIHQAFTRNHALPVPSPGFVSAAAFGIPFLVSCDKPWYLTLVNFSLYPADIGFVLFFKWEPVPIRGREMEKENSKPTKYVDVW